MNESTFVCPIKHKGLAGDLTKGTDEDGWWCYECGARLGFRPDLDRRHLETKVECICQDLHRLEVAYWSNSTDGEVAAMHVVAACRETGRYDQYSIVQFLMAERNGELETQRGGQHQPLSHAAYWQEEARRQLAGERTQREESQLETDAALKRLLSESGA